MEENSKKLTNLDQIGEFGLIELITKDFEIINDKLLPKYLGKNLLK